MVFGLFFDVKSYIDVYDKVGLFGLWLLFGYCIYLSEDEFYCLVEIGFVVVFCLMFNFFIGSGFFDLVNIINVF